MFDAQKTRTDFPIFLQKNRGKKFVYLNNAATTQKPLQVIKAISDFYSQTYGSVHRGSSEISGKATEAFERARENIAGFVNAKPSEIVFTKNATESLNLLAYSLSNGFLKQGDEVLLTKMEHHSNIVPWQELARQKGFSINFMGLNRDGTLDMKDFEAKLSRKTKIVSFTHASNVLGTINDAKQICAMAKDRGVLSIVDAAQSVPHFAVDAKKIGCDFLVYSAHKMLGPTGIGILYGKKERLEEMPPFLFGGDMISEVYFDHSEWNDVPFKFEAGTPNSAGAIGLSAAVDYLKKLGMENIFLHEQKLTKFALEELGKLEFVETYGPPAEKRTGVIAFNVKGIHPHDVGGVLDEFGVEIRTGSHCAHPLMRELGLNTGSARMSFYVYNTKEDIETALDAVKKTFRLMG